MRIEKSIEINQPVEKVFEFVWNPENDPLWQTQVREAKITSDGPLGVGSTTSQTAHFLGRSIETTGEITEHVQNQKFAWKSTSGPVAGEGLFTFESVADGQTKFTMAVDLDIGGFFKVAEPLVARSSKRQVDANLANLKDLLEADADGGD
jgi:uncharacterized membrane protein